MKNRKMLGMLLVSAIFILIFPCISQAKTISGQCGEDAVWVFNTKTKTMKISGSGDMYEESIHDAMYDDSVEGLGDFYKYLEKTRILKIGKNIDKVYSDSLSGLDPDNKVEAEIYCDMDNFENDSLTGVLKIKLHGNADTLASAIDSRLTEVTKSKNNDEILIENDMVLSADKKKLYLYYGDEETVFIPDSVRKICSCAFSSAGRNVTKVILGENVKKIGNKAFYYSKIRTMVCNSSLKKVGTAAFERSKLKSINLPDNVDIGMGAFYKSRLKTIKIGKEMTVGVQAFGKKTVIIGKNGFKNAQISVYEAVIDKVGKTSSTTKRVTIEWAKVKGADGYEVVLTQGDTTISWTQKKTHKSLETDELSRYGRYFYYYDATWNLTYGKINKITNPIFIQVRGYKVKKNGIKVYTRWNCQQILENLGERDSGSE